MSIAYKIPESVLVVIYTPALDVLLIKRADASDFWQSVTGSKDALEESFVQTAVREVFEETGIDCGPIHRWPIACWIGSWKTFMTFIRVGSTVTRRASRATPNICLV